MKNKRGKIVSKKRHNLAKRKNTLEKMGYKVTAVDTQWFGNHLQSKPRLKIIKLDIRNSDQIPFDKVDAVIHLAKIAKDPGVELNPLLSWEINVLATHQLIENAIKNNVKQFIYASSGSVYGIKKEKNVTEDLPLVPISTYNKTKMIAEKVLSSYQNLIKFIHHQLFILYLEKEFEAGSAYKPNDADWLKGQWSGIKVAYGEDRRGDTAVNIDELKEIGRVITTVPENLNIHKLTKDKIILNY